MAFHIGFTTDKSYRTYSLNTTTAFN
jgi:hypothetical protein